MSQREDLDINPSMTPFSSWRREHKEGKKRPWEVPAWWRSLSTRTELSILQAVAGLRGVNLGKQYKASNHLLHWSPPLLLFLSLWKRTANVPLIDWDKRLSGCMWEKLMNCMIFSSVGWLAVQSWINEMKIYFKLIQGWDFYRPNFSLYWAEKNYCCWNLWSLYQD